MIMQLFYYSRTRNTKRFIDKLESDIDSFSITEAHPQGSFILITPTYNFGQIPEEVAEFLENYGSNMVGVISCGNKNWGAAFGQAGNKISDRYGVPLLHKIELSGNKKDKEIVDNIIENML